MLKSVKSYIDELPNITFNQHFVNYMVQVQDTNIKYEFELLAQRNILDVHSMERLIDTTMGRIV